MGFLEFIDGLFSLLCGIGLLAVIAAAMYSGLKGILDLFIK